MPSRREAIKLISTAIAAVPVVSACAPAPAVRRTAAQVGLANQTIIAAATRTRAVDVKFCIRYGDSVTGSHNAKARISNYTNTVNTRQVLWTTVDRMYIAGADQLPEGSVALMTTSQMRASCRMSAGADAMVMLDMLTATTVAEQTGTLAFTGQFDLGKVTGPTNTMKSVEYYSAAAPGNPIVPYELTLDRSGYVCSVNARFGVANEFVYSMCFAEWGVPNNIPLPTSGVVPAPSEMYL